MGALLAALPPLSAQINIFNLEEGLPLQITDTVANRGFALQGATLYDRKRVNEGDKKRDKDSYLLSSELQYGWGNSQVQVEWLRLTGPAERTIQITTAGFFRTLNQQKGLIPSTAVLGKVSFPIGDQSEGYDTSLRFLTALSAGSGERAPRFIFNAEWFRNDKPREEQRRNIYAFSGGYMIRLTQRFLVVADLVWSQADERGGNLQARRSRDLRRPVPQPVPLLGRRERARKRLPPLPVYVWTFPAAALNRRLA